MLTKRELILLRNLRKNSRKPLSRISKETKIPLSTLCDNLKKLEEKVISKHTTLMDFAKIGYPLKIQFAIQTKDKESLKGFLIGSRHVNNIYKATNDYFFIEAFFKNVKELFDFREHIEDNFNIKFIDEHHIIEDYKKEDFGISENLSEQ